MTTGAIPFLEVLQQRSLVPDGCRAVLLVGSAAKGWSNAKSDYDFYLVCDEPWRAPNHGILNLPLDPPEIQTESFYAHDRRWEATYWLATQVKQILAKVSWEEFEKDRVAGQVLAGREEMLLERLTVCVPLLGGQWLAERQREVDASAFRSLIVTRSLGAADDSVEDALGQLESGDLHSAVLSARKALGHSVDALLEQHGQYGSHSPKWRPHRFRAANPAILSFDRYWAVETMQNFDPDKPEKWVTDVLTLCQDIAMKVEL
ncbi:hypothetical protein ACFFKH_10440 [Micromonospora marina]|uniref:Nucleotidyltransferase domain-containing protein n=1 Tax=Micromonospora marina TaxID=307120 RepID=A0A1C5A8Y2_9ACTN|nr:hypothetical protein [Micromonospora marina]SCF41619.1 hypothetical protein GA0070215_12581 [Micromonospora marina]